MCDPGLLPLMLRLQCVPPFPSKLIENNCSRHNNVHNSEVLSPVVWIFARDGPSLGCKPGYHPKSLCWACPVVDQFYPFVGVFTCHQEGTSMVSHHKDEGLIGHWLSTKNWPREFCKRKTTTSYWIHYPQLPRVHKHYASLHFLQAHLHGDHVHQFRCCFTGCLTCAPDLTGSNFQRKSTAPIPLSGLHNNNKSRYAKV